jgi:hypothetical protein
MNDSDLIDALGGTVALARICGLAKSSVSGWRQNGIPRPWRKYFAEIRPDLFVEQEVGDGDPSSSNDDAQRAVAP